MLCDLQVVNYLPKIALPSLKFDKVLILFDYRWPRSKINKIVKDILMLIVAGRVVNKCSCGSVVNHCISSAKDCGLNSQGTHILTKNV